MDNLRTQLEGVNFPASKADIVAVVGAQAETLEDREYMSVDEVVEAMGGGEAVAEGAGDMGGSDMGGGDSMAGDNAGM